MNLILRSLYDDFLDLKECIKMTRKAVASNHILLAGTRFTHKPIISTTTQLTDLEKHIDDWFYITAWACFERELYEFYEQRFKVLEFVRPPVFGVSSKFYKKFSEHSVKKVSRWRSDEILNLLSNTVINEKDKGKITEFKQYRDSIAHKKSAKPPSSLDEIYFLLSGMLDDIEKLK